MNQGLVKLIFSDSFDPIIDVSARLMDSNRLTKQASTIFGRDYSDLKPDKDHIGIHLVALGDFEHYGSNRNGDSFPKAACVRFHDTFVKNACPFRGHANKDKQKSLGHVKASAYNEPMGRIELFIHAHKEKAAPELERLEKEGTIPFSMACKVAYDRCNICNATRKSASDPNQCAHIRDHLGEVFEDGKVACTHNDEPTFFDISFVNRPADRIAWDLKKVAEFGSPSSVELARQYGVILPPSLISISNTGLAKIAICKALAELELLNRSLDKKASLLPRERYIRELRKAAMCKLSNEQVNELRNYEPRIVFSELARRGIVLDPESFFKYAFGTDYGEVAADMPRILEDARNNLFDNLIKSGEYTGVCDNSYFDVDTDKRLGYITHSIKLGNYVLRNLVEPMSLVGDSVDRRVIESTLGGVVARPPELVSKEASSGRKAADMYAAYKLSALKAVMDMNEVDKDSLLAIAAIHGTF